MNVEISGGFVVVIDDEDAPMVTQHKWRALPASKVKGRFYVARTSRRDDGRATTEYLHRAIMNAPRGTDVDHINRDTMDNRRCNLRLATRTLNNANTVLRKSTHGFRGVSRDKATFSARLRHGGKVIRVGNLASAEDAARKYDELAIAHFGAFARLNFPLANQE